MLAILVGGCSLPVVPNSDEPTPPTPTAVVPTPLTTIPESPRGSAPEGGRVVIRLTDERIAYNIEACPLVAWRDPGLEDGVDFGSFPTPVTGDAGTTWLTNLFVLDVANGSARDWSFVLTADSEATPSTLERLVTSRPDDRTTMSVSLTANRATFLTVFRDSATADPSRGRQGSVTVTCR